MGSQNRDPAPVTPGVGEDERRGDGRGDPQQQVANQHGFLLARQLVPAGLGSCGNLFSFSTMD